MFLHKMVVLEGTPDNGSFKSHKSGEQSTFTLVTVIP